MQLLDLPPEIFENLIHELVTEVGVTAAWKLREVCGKFIVWVVQFLSQD